jgi:hypothetical protein
LKVSVMKISMVRLSLLVSVSMLALVDGCGGDNGSPPSQGSGGSGVAGARTGGAGGGSVAATGGAGDGGASGTGGRLGSSGGSGGDSTGGATGEGGAGGDAIDAGSEPGDAGVSDGGSDTAPRAPIPVPAPWASKDIGAAAPAGSDVLTVAANDNQRIQLKGGGATGIGAKADAFHFVHQLMPGDASFMGRVNSLGMIDPGTTAGLMIRETLDPDAAMVFVGPVGDGKMGGHVIVRKQKGADALVTPADPAAPPLVELKAGQWIRLVRQGATIRILAGTRAAVEDESGSEGMVTLSLSKPTAPLYFGLAATSNSAMKATTAKFEDVAIDDLAGTAATRSWNSQSFGTAGGSALWDKEDLVMAGLGNPWNSAPDKSRDFFQYAFFRPDIKPTSHTTLRFLVTSQDMTDPGGRVAAVFRAAADMNGLNRSNPTVALSVTQGAGLELAARTGNGEKFPLEVSATKTGIKAPIWLRLDRQLALVPGDALGRIFTQVRAYYAPDDKGTPGKWLAVGEPISFDTIGPADFATLGIAVSSYDPAVVNHAHISKPTVEAAPAPPPVPLPKPDAGPATDGGSATADAADGGA